MLSKKYYVFLIYLQLVSSLRLQRNSRLSGFVLVDNNFTYVEEIVPSLIDIAANPNGSGGGERFQDAYNPNGRDVVSPGRVHVRFDPPVLYFKDKAVGNSYRETVYIFNTSQNKTLRMEKIAGGKHSQIQIAAFGDELVAPSGNTTFDIIFIGKDLIPLSTHYYIYTSEGILKYDVISWCIENPYRITPMSSITLPLNSSYSHSIILRNPFPEPLQITEALLHGGDYTSHTLPPNIDFENAIESWTIQPYETKEILRVHFLTYEAWNLSTFQSIKLGTGTTLLIPVEVEVVPRTGLYVPGNKIDFVSGGHLDPPAVRPLHICSSAKKTVTIENVSCESRIDGCEVVDFKPTALPPWSCAMNPVAKVKFTWSTKLPGDITSGGVLIKNDLDPLFRVNYMARVHHGGLTYNSSLTHYITGISSFNSSSRPFAFMNEYRELIAVMNVYLSFEAAEYFHIRDFEPSVLRPQEKRVLFNLQTRKGVKLKELKLDSSILLETNISTIRLPLRVYDGLLAKLSKVAPTSLHVGLVGAKATVVTYFGLSNANPVTIFVKYFGCNDTSVRIELLDVKQGNVKTFYYRSFLQSVSGLQHSGGFNIHPHHYASFKLSVNTSDTEGEFFAEVWVQSEYQRLIFPLKMSVAEGFIRISPDPFEFEDCFPGSYCIQQLMVESHFKRSMSIVNISTIPFTTYDKLLFYPNIPAVIVGHSTSIVGNILWEPSIHSSQTWPLGYLGLPNNRTGRDRWLGTIERPNITRDFDLTLMESQYLRYREQYSAPIDLTFRMDTTEIRNFLFKARIQLQWPQIVISRVIDFPLVQIGSVSYENVSVFNPMRNHYMTVQAIMAQHYQQEVPTVVGTIISDYEESGGVEAKSNEFFLDTVISSPYKCNVLSGTKRKFTNHRSSVVFVLPPQTNTTIRIGFMPSSQSLTTTRLYLRNDFTILDSVAINGAGAYPQLTVEGIENSAANLIKFVIPYETLKLCEENNNKVLNITTKKIFRLRNTGQVSVHIFGFTINGLQCQGYGFKITNCHNTSFILKPGMSKRIEILFTPDFSSARVESKLQVESDIKMGPMLSYTLYAALDSDWLRKCKPHLQRPYWEPLVYYLVIGMFFFLLIGIAIMAVYEVSISTSRLINSFGGVEPKMQPFYDLKLIEMFFVRSSVPHHHHHHHYHHRTSAMLMQSKSDAATATITKSQQSVFPITAAVAVAATAKENGSIPNGHISPEYEHEHEQLVCTNYIGDVNFVDGLRPTANVISASPATTLATATSTTISSSQSLIYNSSVRTSYSILSNIGGSETPRNMNTTASTTVSEKREKLESQPSLNYSSTFFFLNILDIIGMAAKDVKSFFNGIKRKGKCEKSSTFFEKTSTSPETNRCTEVSAPNRPKKGKKYDFEEVCYKSNWLKKKQSKKEEKIAGNKFLKNEWTRCLKGSNSRIEDKCNGMDKRCGCSTKYSDDGIMNENCLASPAMMTRAPAFMTEFSSANVSSQNNITNSKISNKDVPRKLEFDKVNAKKTSRNSPNDFSTYVTTETSSGNGTWLENKSGSKLRKQKAKKSIELSKKFKETIAKENVKENFAVNVTQSSPTKKLIRADEKSKSRAKDSQRKSEQPKGADTQLEALKPITNLPKGKEPFETLSSLCKDSVNLKSKRKSNVKERIKDEKFSRIAKELSIVFTPDSNESKPSADNKTKRKVAHNSDSEKKQQHHSTSTLNHQGAPTIKNEIRKRSGIVASLRERTMQMRTVQHQQHRSSSSVDEDPRILNEGRSHSTSYFSNGELYSRVVAPSASRSSPSSSSSDSNTSYESSRTLPSKIRDNHQPSTQLFWDTWNNDMFFQGVILSKSYQTCDIPVFAQDKIETTNTSNFSIDHSNLMANQPASNGNLFCCSNQSKQEENISSDADPEDNKLHKFAKNSLSDEEDSCEANDCVIKSTTPAASISADSVAAASTLTSKPVLNDIWGPPTSLYPWSPSDLSGPSNTFMSDTVSAISLSRLLRFEEKKEKDVEQYGSLSSLWSADTKSLWGHPKHE